MRSLLQLSGVLETVLGVWGWSIKKGDIDMVGTQRDWTLWLASKSLQCV